MEQWVPLLEIFLKSPCPVGEASHWVQTQQGKGGLTAGGLWRFVPQLLANNVVFYQGEEEAYETTNINSSIGNCMWIQTLPSAMQSSILTFLSAEHSRFRKKDLEKLARNLVASLELDFWVRRAAENLFHTIIGPNTSQFFKVENDPKMHEYNALPEWLEDYRKGSNSLFPWLPVASEDSPSLANNCPESSKEQTVCQTKATLAEKFESSRNTGVEGNLASPGAKEFTGESVAGFEPAVDEASEIQHATSCISVEAIGSEVATSMEVEMMDHKDIESRAAVDPEVHAQSLSLREALLSSESNSSISRSAEKIRTLCSSADCMGVLSVVKPWEADDEVTLKLVETLLKEQEGYTWSTEILCSVILPKLLALKEPASRVLVTAVLQAAKAHQRATVDALLFPLILRKKGLNVAVCEVLNRIIKDCLNADHISSFCQKLLFEVDHRKSVICLPCHQSEISHCLVWTEPVFTLLQNILNQQVPLPLEAIEKLVLALDDVAEEFSKSLKFGNFLLCLVNKYGSLLKHYKASLRRIAERTNTFMTKSVLTKLASL
eukprot:Gb_19011 [translate_table: standard]